MCGKEIKWIKIRNINVWGKEIVKVMRKLKPWNICTAAVMMWANYFKYFLQFEY